MAELPSGVVTFLFTDIEGSTRLVKQFRDRYEEVLADHQRVLRAAFAAHSGHEVDTQGDSFFVAFSSARDALVAAIEGQFALLSHAWPDGVHVKVRMGLHTGQARAADGRYTGLAVHRAARVGAAGHGGQILVSQATQTLLEDEEEAPHVFLRDLGEHRLKDLDRPVRLYQACAEGLPESFPPPRGEAPLAEAAEVALAPPLWRRRPIVAAAGLVLLTLIAIAVLASTRHSAGGLSSVQPNHVGVIDPNTNEIVDEIQVGNRPGPITVGGGSVWVGNLDERERTLTKIDAGRRTSTTFTLNGRTPTGIDYGEAAVWVAHGVLGELSRVDPEFGIDRTVTVADQALGSMNGAVTVGPGAVWAVYGDSTLAQIDPITMRFTATRHAGSNPAGVAVHGSYVWVLNTDDAGVRRYHPDSFQEGPLGTTTVGARPTAIAAGENALWVANTGGDSVTRVDPGTPPTTSEIRDVGEDPTAIAVGEGSVWVANQGDGTVSRIDPTTLEVVETIDVGNAPSGIAVGDGFVWVSVQSP